MSLLGPRDVDQFGKILGYLGSEFDGERAVAAAKATNFLKTRKLDWCDVTAQLKQLPVVVAAPSPQAPSRSHQVDARRCLQSPIPWKPHERKFLGQMADQLRRPSDAQRDWLDGLLDRVAAYLRRQADADF